MPRMARTSVSSSAMKNASFPSAAVRTIFWWISSAASGEPSSSHVFSWKKCSAPVAGNGASMR